MKKSILIIAMLLMAVSSSFAYDNAIGVLTSPTIPSSVDSKTASINKYCEVRFRYVIDKGHLSDICYGRVLLKHGNQVVAGIESYSSTGWGEEYLTGQWYTLELEATGYNAYAHGLLYW